MNARLSPLAWPDAFDAAEWYDLQSNGLGDQCLGAIERLLADLAHNPRLYARVRRPIRGREIRETPIDRFPFVATYEITGTELVILSITHGRSIKQPWRKRLSNP